MIRFTAVGTPRPKGSATVVEHDRRGNRLPRAMLIPQNSHKLDQWEKSVAGAALATVTRQGRERFPINEPIVALLLFRLCRPDSHFGVRGLRPTAPRVPAVKPDIDKLTRAVLDAVTGLVIGNDSRVVFVAAGKVYATDQDVPGVEVAIAPLDDDAWCSCCMDVAKRLLVHGAQLELAGGKQAPHCPRCDAVDAGRKSGLCVTCAAIVARGDA
jgi:Holliday junction resolvase RusA-like endonuclease